MYHWERQRKTLNVPASRIVLLERSLSDVEVKLPDLSPELSRAYLCVYKVRNGLRIAVVLHLLKSQQFAFYMDEGCELDAREAERNLVLARQFAESLGFMLGDLDFRQLKPDVQLETWQQLEFLHPRVPKQASSAGQARPPAAKPAASASSNQGGKGAAPIPGQSEMARHRQQFIENLGRLLAMF